MMYKTICRIGCLLLLLYAASLQSFAEMLPLDSSIRRTDGTADCAWFYSRDAVNIGGQQYSGHGYVVDNRGGRAVGAITFDISGWERFTAVAGLKDEWRGQDGKITITVDGIEQFTRQLRAGEAGVAVDIALMGNKRLTISMEPSMLLAQPLLFKQIAPATLNVNSTPTPTGASVLIDGSITRTGGTADCAWFYSSDAVSIGGQQYSGHGYVVDNRGGRADGAIVFDISGWERFTAVAGLKDEWRGQDGKITIEVDGRQQFTKQLRAGEAGVAVDIGLTGKKSLTITMVPSMLLAQPLLLKQNASATLNVKFTPTGASFVIVEKLNPIDGAAMVWVPGGTFTMGSPDGVGEKNERPAHLVTLTGYWIYKYEVTVAQYRAFCVATNRKLPNFPTIGYSWQGKRGWDDPALQQHPIVNVSWHDAQAYATWASAALSTEAQWEYAARGPEGRNYPWGGTATANDSNNGWDKTKCVNYSYNGGKSTWPVGSFPGGASWCGAQDMAGNAWEWCADWYGVYASTSVTNPTGPAAGDYRVLRGGCWNLGSDLCRSAYRGIGGPLHVWGYDGFRCVSLSPGP